MTTSVQAEARGLAPGSANSPTAKARGSVKDVVPALDEAQAQALAGGRGSSTDTSVEDDTRADDEQPAA